MYISIILKFLHTFGVVTINANPNPKRHEGDDVPCLPLAQRHPNLQLPRSRAALR